MQLLFKDSINITDVQITETATKLLPYINQLNLIPKTNNYDSLESSIDLPFDKQIINEVVAVYQKLKIKPKYVINIGIGGSNLGTKAVYDALLGYCDILTPNRFPKMIFSDTTDPEFLEKLILFLKKEITSLDQIMICVISKSGTTTETIANFEIIYQSLSSKFADINGNIVIITDFNSKLWQSGQGKNIVCLPIPKTVGGRYSVFSAVGLLPLLAVGIDIGSLLEGAMTIREQCLSNDIFANPALLSAIIIYLEFEKGKIINDNFIFHPELESLGKWYRQLMGESLGKEKDLNGKTVSTGITPTVSIGSTDLHSVGQLYLGGPKDKITTFIYTRKANNKLEIPANLFFPSLVSHLENKPASQIISAILQGVKIAYRKKELPFVEVVLDDLQEKSLGEFMQFKMIEMMLLGKLFNVNPFDQPNVEDYKMETKKFLL